MSKELVIPSKFTIDDKFSSGFKNMMNSTKAQLGGVQGEMSKFSSFVKNNQDSFRTMGRNATIAGGVILGTFGLMANEAIKFEDKLSDVAKTTGLQGRVLDDFGSSILSMSENTRTSIEDLATIGEMGGQMGVAQKDLLSFTDAANKFNVALGSDFGSVDEAVTSVSKINSLFRDTRDLDVASNITKVGSAINQLGAIGAATSQNMTDFMLRVGSMPDALKPSLTATAALGAYLEESGIDAQIASSGFANFTKTAATNLGAMSKVMGITATEAQALFNTDSVGFAAKFAQSTKKMSGTELANTFKGLQLNSLEVQKVIGALSNDVVDAGTGMSRLGSLTAESNGAFKDGVSLMTEYNTKNSTTAAEMDKAKNTIKSLSITIGQQLLPVIADLMKDIMPMVKSFSSWAKENKTLVAGIAKFTVGLGATLAVLGPVLFAIGSYNKLMKSFSIATDISKVAMKSFGIESKISMKSLGMAAGVIALTSISLDTYAFSTRKAMTSTELLNNVGRSSAMIANEQLIETRLLFDQLRKNKEGTDNYKTALQQIDQMQPGLIEKYGLQEKSLVKLKNAENELEKSIKSRALEQAKKQQLVDVNAKVLDLEQKVANTEGQGAISEFIQGFGDYENTHSQLKKSLEIAKQERSRVEASFDSVDGQDSTGGGKHLSPQMSEQISNITKSEVLLKIDNNGSIQNVNLTGGSNFAMNVVPNVASTMK